MQKENENLIIKIFFRFFVDDVLVRLSLSIFHPRSLFSSSSSADLSSFSLLIELTFSCIERGGAGENKCVRCLLAAVLRFRSACFFEVSRSLEERKKEQKKVNNPQLLLLHHHSQAYLFLSLARLCAYALSFAAFLNAN